MWHLQIRISDLIAVERRRTRSNFSVSLKFMAENESDFDDVLVFQCASEFCYKVQYNNKRVNW